MSTVDRMVRRIIDTYAEPRRIATPLPPARDSRASCPRCATRMLHIGRDEWFCRTCRQTVTREDDQWRPITR